MQIGLFHIPTGLCIGVYNACHTTANTIHVADIHFNPGTMRPTRDEMKEHKTQFALNTGSRDFPSWASQIRKADIIASDDLSKVPDEFMHTYHDALSLETVTDSDGVCVVKPAHLIALLQDLDANVDITDLDFDNVDDSRAEITVRRNEKQKIGSTLWNAKCLETIKHRTRDMFFEARDAEAQAQQLKRNEQTLRDIISQHPDLAKRIIAEEA